jgi:hypothetical protein
VPLQAADRVRPSVLQSAEAVLLDTSYLLAARK